MGKDEMLNFDDLRLKINPLYEGEELVNKLLILPEVDSKALSKGEKLFKLLELYKIFIPNKKIEVIYNNLYLSLVASLERKGTLDEVRLLNNIYKFDSPNKRFGVAGGLDSFKILGRSGTGKTTALYRCAELICPDNLIQFDNSDREIIPFLIIECPSDGSFKGLLFSIMHKIDSILGTNYFRKQNPRFLTTDFLMNSVSSVLINHVGVLVIDEIERVANDSRRGETLINYLTQLVNQTNVSVVFVGDKSSDKYFVNREYMSRRTLGIELTKLDYNEDFYNFCSCLFRYQFTNKKVELDSKLLRCLYGLTNGLPSLTVILFIETQKKAILENINSISEELFNQVFDEVFSNMKSYIRRDNSINKQRPIIDNQVSIKTQNHCRTSIFSEAKSKSDGDIDTFIELLLKDIEIDLVKL